MTIQTKKTKERCENPGRLTGWDTNIPVVHHGSNINYQNIHCALCHNVSRKDLFNWKVAVHCSNGKLVPSSIETILDEAKRTKNCNIVYIYPLQNTSMDKCEPVVSRCNKTGEWAEYDAVTEAACHAYIDIYEGKYKNIFCYLCNLSKPYIMQSECTYGNSGVSPTFSALLKFRTPLEEHVLIEDTFAEVQTEHECKESQIFDKFEVRQGFNILFLPNSIIRLLLLLLLFCCCCFCMGCCCYCICFVTVK